MFDGIDIESLKGSQIDVLGRCFSIDDQGYVTSDKGNKLGHVEECLEVWDTINKLFEAIEAITLSI